MSVHSNYLQAPMPKGQRSYSVFVKTLKIIQALGYIVVLLVAFGIGVSAGNVILGGIFAVVGIFFVYLSTQGLIAIIDLLSQIEYNTRQPQQVEYQVEYKDTVQNISLTSEELAIFRILSQPNMNLTQQEKREVKLIVQKLLATLQRGLLINDWNKRQVTRDRVKKVIEDILHRLPQSYSKTLYKSKCEEVYRYICDSYTT